MKTKRYGERCNDTENHRNAARVKNPPGLINQKKENDLFIFKMESLNWNNKQDDARYPKHLMNFQIYCYGRKTRSPTLLKLTPTRDETR